MATINFKDGAALLPDNFVTRQQLRDWIFQLQPETGTNLKAIEDVATTGILRQTNATVGSKAIDTTPAGAGASAPTSETITGDGTVDITEDITIFDAVGGGPYTVTLPDGTSVGQKHTFFLLESATKIFYVVGNIADFTQIELGDVAGGRGRSAQVEWDGATWQWMAGNAILT